MEEIKDSKEFKEGLFGEPTDALAEQMSIQAVEGNIAIPLLEKIYGGYNGFNNIGVVYYQNQSQGAKYPGLWIGIKKADERLKEFVDTMQAKVDAGEIKAEYIYIFYSPFTISENNQLMDLVSKEVRKIQQQHETPERLAGSTSVDTITGEIEIGHNFLTEEQKESLRKKFSEYTIVFKQEGRMAPIGDEPDTIYPEDKYIDQRSKEGDYIMELSEDGFQAVQAKPSDFSKNGGDEEFYSATNFSFPHASKKLKIGQRVKIEVSGPVQTSYPGQGTALYVEVLPEYKPEKADLSESQVVQATLEKLKEDQKTWPLAIRDLSYDEKDDTWKVSLKRENEIFEIEINDEVIE